MRKLLLIIYLFLVSISSYSQQNNTNSAYEVTGGEAARATLDLSSDQALISKYQSEVKNSRNGIDVLNSYTNSGSSGFNTLSTSVLLERYQNQVSKDAAINTLAGKIALYFGAWFGGAFVLLSLFLNYYNNVIKGRNTLDWGKVMRDGALYICLVAYVPVMGGVNWLANGLPWMVQYISKQSQEENVFVQFTILANKPEWGLTKAERNNVLRVAKQQENGTNPEKNIATLLAMIDKVKQNETYSITENDSSGFFAVSQTLMRIYNAFQNLPNDIIIGILILLASVAKFVVFVIFFAMDKILFCLGPLAILVSYIGIFKDKWITWLSRWLTIKCTLATLVLVDAILLMIQNTDAMEGVYGQAVASQEFTLGFAIVAIVMYIMSFWLTSAWIGSAEAGKFLSTTAAVVTTAIGGSKALAAFNKAGGGGNEESKGGSTSSATNLGSKATRDNPENINR